MTENISFNFGAIRDTVTKLSASEILRGQKSNTLEKFLNEVQKKPILVKQEFVFKNIENAKPFQKERLAERFIAQNMQLFKNEKWSDILSENKRIRKELLNDIRIESRIDNKLAESINTLIEFNTNTHIVTPENVEREVEAYEYVVNYLIRNVNESDQSKEKTDNPNLKDSWKFITKVAINNFNERYEHLNEEEKKVFSVLISDEKTKNNFLEEIKNENLNKIKELLESKDLDSDTKKILESFEFKINNMKNVNFVNIDEYILNNIELKSHLS